MIEVLIAKPGHYWIVKHPGYAPMKVLRHRMQNEVANEQAHWRQINKGIIDACH